MKYLVNNKYTHSNTFVLDGVDEADYPDFCDAFIGIAEFEDGTELNELEINELNDKYYDSIDWCSLITQQVL
jgi:hypothetical protein